MASETKTPAKPTKLEVQIAMLESLYACLKTSAEIQESVLEAGFLTTADRKGKPCKMDEVVDAALSDPNAPLKGVNDPSFSLLKLRNGREIRLFRSRVHAAAIKDGFSGWSVRDQVIMSSAIHVAKTPVSEEITDPYLRYLGNQKDVEEALPEIAAYQTYLIEAVLSVMAKQPSPFIGHGKKIKVNPTFLALIEAEIDKLSPGRRQHARGQKHINWGWWIVAFGVGVTVLTGALVFTNVINLNIASAATMEIGIPSLGNVVLAASTFHTVMAVALLAVAFATIMNGLVNVHKGFKEQRQAEANREGLTATANPAAFAPPSPPSPAAPNAALSVPAAAPSAPPTAVTLTTQQPLREPTAQSEAESTAVVSP